MGGLGVPAGDQQGVLRQAVTGQDRLRAQPVAREAADEGAQGLGAHRLGPVEGHPQAGQVQVRGLLLGDAAGAQLVAEVGGGGAFDPVVVDHAQPAVRLLDEGDRRHLHAGAAHPQRVQGHADEPHVVVEGQPAARHDAVRGHHGAADGLLVGGEVGVRDHDALRLAGGAGAVLEEGHVRLGDAGRGPQVGVGRLGVPAGRQAQHIPLSRGGQPGADALPVLRERQHRSHIGVPQDAVDAGQPFARFVGQRCGDRRAPRVEAAQEGRDEVQGRRVEQQYRTRAVLPGRVLQPGGHQAGPAVQFGVAELLGPHVRAVLVQVDERGPLRMAVHAGAYGVRHRPELKLVWHGLSSPRTDPCGGTECHPMSSALGCREKAA